MERYNQAACEIVQKYGGEINDLYAMLKNAPMDYHSDQTHYYTKDGTRAIANQVIKCIQDSLSLNANVLDFDMLFAPKDDAIGL